MSDATARFDARADDYARFRPSYPAAALDALFSRASLAAGDVAVDAGSGTGILTGLLLERGLEVHAVEPNSPMREVAERDFASSPGFHSVGARARDTGLPDASVALVTAAQAFHWFDRDAVDAEFRRVLAPGGWLALLWNSHCAEPGSFTGAYEDVLVRFGEAYARVTTSARIEVELEAFYRDASLERATFPNPMSYDWPTLIGRARSSSYAPLEGAPEYEAFVEAMREAFDAHASDGVVSFTYETALYLGRLGV